MSNFDCYFQEPHKTPLFTVEVAPYVLPSLGFWETRMGTSEERDIIVETLKNEPKRVYEIKQTVQKRKNYGTDLFDTYPEKDSSLKGSEYRSMIRSEILKEATDRLSKSMKQRALPKRTRR